MLLPTRHLWCNGSHCSGTCPVARAWKLELTLSRPKDPHTTNPEEGITAPPEVDVEINTVLEASALPDGSTSVCEDHLKGFLHLIAERTL